MGIAGFGALASLAVYRDYFIALALLALAYSFFLTLRKKYRARTLNFRNYSFGRDDIILLVTAVLVTWAILFPNIRGITPGQAGVTYEGRGSVVQVDAGGKKITLKHEEIKGLMPAMTMQFPTKSTDVIQGIREGDRITFTLSAQGSDFIVDKVVKEEK